MDAWASFLNDPASLQKRGDDAVPYRVLVEEAAMRDGPYRSLVIDFEDVDRRDTHLADELIEHPRESLNKIEDALKTMGGTEIHARVRNLPDSRKRSISTLRDEDVGKLVAVTGVVQGVGETRPRITDGIFQCARCGAFIRQIQEDPFFLAEPLECEEDQGGCGRDTSWKLVTSETRGKRSTFVDTQGIHLQEPPDTIQGTKTPERFPCFIEGDWCGRIMPGERVVLTGILRSYVRRVQGKKSTTFDLHLEVLSFDVEQRTYADIVFTDKDVEAFHALAKDSTLREKLIGSIAPSIHGRREAKVGILLQLFGGTKIDLPDGQKKRGAIHILLIGDPGQGKTVLLKAASALHPRAFYANMLTMSVAGLVGGVEKAEKGIGGETYVYQGGLAVMAHEGHLSIDEADKPKEKDAANALLEPLEQQHVSLNKMGARGLTIATEFSALIGANPKTGRFDPTEPLALQLTLPGPLLDRMDLIFPLDDSANLKRDENVIDHLIRSYQYGTVAMAARAGGKTAVSAEDVRTAGEKLRPVIEAEFLRKYIAYARRNVWPYLTDEASVRIRAQYLLVRGRRSANPEAPTPYSTRSGESILRLATAAARMRLSNTIDEEDVDLALEIYNVGWERLATNKNGEMDMDRIGAATPSDTRTLMRAIKQKLQELTDLSPSEAVTGEDVVRHLIAAGLERDRVVAAWGQLKKTGQIIERANGGYANVAPYRPSKDVRA